MAREAPVTDRFVTRGFVGRRGAQDPGHTDIAARIPPGQYLTTDFPVLSAGPTPRTPLDRWSFSIEGLVREPVVWTWESFMALPSREWTVDISCVTKWTKLDMRWRGVSVDTLFEHVDLDAATAFAIGWSDGGYTTNLPLADILNGQAFIAFEYDGKPLAPEHGGPARLVVPGRYFWKSAKWVRGLRLQSKDEPGFWESLGYHNRGDQWREERYSGD
jgi:DMSO/TMAO reductase YedYZ molybdopterin-dependent catalytic subunit